MDAACEHIDNRLTPFYPQFIREVTKEDILRLMEIKMGRILKFNTDKAEEIIAKMKSDIAEIDAHLANIVGYTIDWYQMLKDKYGKNFPRRTELRHHRSNQSGRSKREAIYQPGRGFHRNSFEERRICGLLLGSG